MNLNRRTAGFTLVEIMLVVIIIGILAAMVIPNFAGRSKDAQLKATKNDIEVAIPMALDMFEIENGGYPTTDQGLKALIRKPDSGIGSGDTWNGPYLKKKDVPSDPWGNSYVYVSPGVNNPESFDLYSFGADGKESADDITNWNS
ncbi:MAG: type II secretion system major pseudopilin GspG [Candidatus Omnitrophica bacterium]|nr:type II secretion system major pseudopilin GspG [Candidatus Omnitrophota bacterium]